MELSTGIDIVDIPRFEKKLLAIPEMLDRLFTMKEREGADVQTLAGKWAAKEAIKKADNTFFDAWTDIEILTDDTGKPRIQLTAKTKKKIDISIAHEKEFAIAVAVVYDG